MNTESHMGQRVRTPHRLVLGRKIIPEQWEGEVVIQIDNGPGWTILGVLWDATGEIDRVPVEEVEIIAKKGGVYEVTRNEAIV